MIGKPKVMICIGMICLGAFLTHSSDIRAAELRESEVEDELREDEDADTEIVFDADTAINRTAAKSALADLHGVFVFRDAFIRQEQIVNSQQKQNYEKMEQIVLTIPVSAKKFRTRSSVTNCGTAIAIIKSVLHIFGHFVVLELIAFARRIPPKNVVNVASTAHSNVQPRILRNAYPKVIVMELANRLLKFAKPTQ